MVYTIPYLPDKPCGLLAHHVIQQDRIAHFHLLTKPLEFMVL
jgi:hypothetical protein